MAWLFHASVDCNIYCKIYSSHGARLDPPAPGGGCICAQESWDWMGNVNGDKTEDVVMRSDTDKLGAVPEKAGNT